MNISIETLTIFVFLIPGFVSSLIINTIVVRKEKDNLSKIIEALIFSFFNLCGYIHGKRRKPSF
ncbi:MAG: hypothetical protein QG591_1054 [Planctomycetota bacterium]|nr:hypothetical protein [Planctomycetota bacterium]